MTGALPVALLLAVAASLCFAGAAVLQHRAIRSRARTAAPGRVALAPVAMARLLVERRWLTGAALGAAGAGLHAVALVLAPVSVVQPVGVLAVPFAVLLAGRGRPPAGVVAGAGLSVAAVAVLVRVTAGSGTGEPPTGGGVALVGAVTGAWVLVLALLAARARGRLRCVAAATAGAVAFGLVSALVRALAQWVAGPADLRSGPVPATAAGLLLALLAGGWLVQQAFASGPPAVVVGVLTVVDPLVAVGIGTALLGEGAGTGPVELVVLTGAALAAAAGVALLARHHPAGVPHPPAGAAPARTHRTPPGAGRPPASVPAGPHSPAGPDPARPEPAGEPDPRTSRAGRNLGRAAAGAARRTREVVQ